MRAGAVLALRVTSLFGTVLFGLAFVVTWASPLQVERAARGFIERTIENQVSARITIVRDGLASPRIARFAEALSHRHAAELKFLRAQLAVEIKPLVARTVARLQDPACACRAEVRRALAAATALRISAIDRAEPQVRALIEGRYADIVADLLHDLRIVTGVNFLLFAGLLALSILRPQQGRALLLPAALLVISTIVTSLVYLFGQNWFFTILYADYVGYGYAAWLFLVFGLLCDIALFRARTTMRIVDLFATALSSFTAC